jgi:hypothetical protein
MDEHDSRLRELWVQKNISVIFRRSSPDPLLLRLPFAADNFEWIRGDRRHKPKWNPQYSAWEIPVAWFDEIAAKVLKRFGKVYVIQLYKKDQKCAPACWSAKGLHCECSCMGAHHGTGHPHGRWHEVSETFAFSWGPKQYACRLLSSLPGQ